MGERMARLIVHLAFSHNKMDSPPHSLRQEEIAALSGPDEFAEFYRRLKQVRTFDLLWFSFVFLPSPLPPPPFTPPPLLCSSPPPSPLSAEGLPSQVSLRRGGANADGVS